MVHPKMWLVFPGRFASFTRPWLRYEIHLELLSFKIRFSALKMARHHAILDNPHLIWLPLNHAIVGKPIIKQWLGGWFTVSHQNISYGMSFLYIPPKMFTISHCDFFFFWGWLYGIALPRSGPEWSRSCLQLWKVPDVAMGALKSH